MALEMLVTFLQCHKVGNQILFQLLMLDARRLAADRQNLFYCIDLQQFEQRSFSHISCGSC